jgi:teichuronic acid biosynthesis glycosyltransferase TuaC
VDETEALGSLRIAILTTSYPQGDSDPAGHFVAAEAALLADQGHDVHVVAPGTRAAARAGGDGAKVWRVGAGRLFGFPGALPRMRENPFRAIELSWFAPRVRRRLSAIAPIDRVIAHFIVPCGYPLALGAARELEVVLHGSDVQLVLGMPRWMRLHIVRRLLAARATFRFVSRDLRARFLAGIPAPERDGVGEACRVELPRLVVPPSIATARQAVRPPRGERWVVCGRLIAGKRIDRAIHVAAQRGAHLTVVGDGPMSGELHRLAASLGGAVRFLGHLPRDQALAQIANADRLVHFSEAEGCPTVIREARALGVPVLATPVGDLVEWAAADPGIEIHRDVATA